MKIQSDDIPTSDPRSDPRFTDNLRAPMAPATLGSVGIRSHSTLDDPMNDPWHDCIYHPMKTIKINH